MKGAHWRSYILKCYTYMFCEVLSHCVFSLPSSCLLKWNLVWDIVMWGINLHIRSCYKKVGDDVASGWWPIILLNLIPPVELNVEWRFASGYVTEIYFFGIYLKTPSIQWCHIYNFKSHCLHLPMYFILFNYLDLIIHIKRFRFFCSYHFPWVLALIEKSKVVTLI